MIAVMMVIVAAIDRDDRDLLLFAATANSFAKTVPFDFFDFRFRSFGLACLLYSMGRRARTLNILKEIIVNDIAQR